MIKAKIYKKWEVSRIEFVRGVRSGKEKFLIIVIGYYSFTNK